MKNTIILVCLISAAIIFTVISISFFKENPDVSFKREEYNAPVEPEFDLQLEIVTTPANFWNRIAGLKTTEEPEDAVVAVTDENGEAVTDENGEIIPSEEFANDEEAAVTSVPGEDEETEEAVTEAPSDKSDKKKKK